MDQVAKQREYYRQTADHYDKMHLGDPEHEFALVAMTGLLGHLGIKSVLDVGSGTGRAIFAVKNAGIQVIGIEPADGLREIGYKKGLRTDELLDGDAQTLPFDDASFDLVCAFGVMHHIPDPDRAVLEMMRVAKRAVFISDHNDPGRGTASTKLAKRALKALGLWGVYKTIITRGKGYRITDDDGLWYPYSILDTYKTILPHCSKIHFLSTLPSGPNMHGASHITILALKD
jgi:ubiquinone/menaquinone biosynthesis C-methylase UbiE